MGMEFVAKRSATLLIHQELRIVVVGVSLMKVSVKSVEPLAGGAACGAFATEAPFAKQSGRVAALLE